jgi:hypothetical protein
MGEILGPLPLFDPSQQPPHHQPEVEEKMVIDCGIVLTVLILRDYIEPLEMFIY